MNQALRVSLSFRLSLVSGLAFWIGISASLISPSLAQVNGPGTSPASSFDAVIDLSNNSFDFSFEFLQSQFAQTIQFNVNDGIPSAGRLGSSVTARSGVEVNVNAGTVGQSFTAESGSEVNISGGAVSRSFRAESGSVVNISGGTVDYNFRALSGSVVNISGGAVTSFGSDGPINALSGSVVNISGGILGRRFMAFSDSEVNISGGTVGNAFTANSGSDVELIGGEFRLNGADFNDSSITLNDDDVFTGTFADGSSFIFSDDVSDILANVSLTAAALPALDLSPIVINAPVDSGPVGLRVGQTLTLQPGGSLLRDNFAVVDATLNVAGGSLGDSAEAYNSVVNISGGSVGKEFDALDGSEVNISGGSVGRNFRARSGSEVNVSGGTVGSFLVATPGSEVNISGGNVVSLTAGPDSLVNISGGTVAFDSEAFSGSVVNISAGNVANLRANAGSVVNISGGSMDSGFEAHFGGVVNISGGAVGNFEAFSGGVVNISGGSVASGFEAFAGSEVNISGGTFIGDDFDPLSDSVVNFLGSEFFIDGSELDTLQPGEAFTITDRDVTLSGFLADGEPFSFILNPAFDLRSGVRRDAIITVTLESVLLGDCNLDGVVDFSDIPAFISALLGNGYLEEADVNQDGMVDFSDINPFITVLISN